MIFRSVSSDYGNEIPERRVSNVVSMIVQRPLHLPPIVLSTVNHSLTLTERSRLSGSRVRGACPADRRTPGNPIVANLLAQVGSETCVVEALEARFLRRGS